MDRIVPTREAEVSEIAVSANQRAQHVVSADGQGVQADREEDTTPLRDWFGSGPDIQLTEQVLGLGRYGRVLTVLTPEDATDDEEREEDEAMVASWTPTFSRSRRR